jgi:N-acetylglucosaminyl-diphospho-decaprenol L-rhamnosyltransferase
MRDSAAELSVCIVNWRTAGLTIDCLKSICAERKDVTLRVVVVDNLSGDGSAEQILSAIQREGWQDWVSVVEAPRNGGFAYGNNIAIRQFLRDDPGLRYVLLLNPDTLVRPGAFRAILDFMEQHPDAGMAGGISEDLDGTRQHCSFRFPSVANEFLSHAKIPFIGRLFSRWEVLAGMPDKPEKVGWVSGAHLIIRREVIDQIGLLDEAFFLYFEETDYIHRASRAGWTCWHVPASRVVHLVGQSSGLVNDPVTRKPLPDYWFESRRRYFVLNHGRLYACLADLAVLTGLLLWRVRRSIQGLPDVFPPLLASGILRLGALKNSNASLRPPITKL